ncbi:MAG: phospholipase D-like domain-containing protein [Kofleriaceae bacterium]
MHSTAGGVVLELEPEPFSIQDVLRTLAAGLPSFYIGLAGLAPSDFAAFDGSLVRVEELLRTVATAASVWIAIVAQERVTLPMTTWSARIGGALTEASPSWTAFSTAIDAAVPAVRAPVFVLDARGNPLTGVPIDVVAGTTSFTVTLAEADGGDLQRALVAAGRPPLWSSAASATLSIAGGPASHRWVTFQDGTQTDGSATVTPASPHVLFTDLHTWFAPQHVQSPPNNVLPRFTYGNRADFFIDGAKYFRNVVAEARTLREIGDAWIVFASWGLSHDFKLGPLRGASAADAPTFMELLEELCGGAAPPPVQIRVLLTRFIQIEDQTALWVGWALIAMLALFEYGLGKQLELASLDTDAVGLGLLIGALVIIAASTPGNDLRSMEKNVGPFDAINGSPFAANARAVWSRLPVTKADNPFATQPLPFQLESAGALHYGVHHTKALAMRRGSELVGFLGGMDLVGNRRDDRRRLAPGPYYDVQAKVEGPAAADLARTLLDRWDHDVARETDFGGADDPRQLPALTLPMTVAALDDGTEIVQIARTYPRILDPSRQLDFAPDGDFTIHDTLIQAIGQAREYIYIEDQYFTPGAVYRQALLDALPNIQRLVVINPTFGDQPLGDLRRRDFIQQLKSAAPDKVIIRAPIRRPTMPPARTRASMGRVFLQSALPAVPGLAEEVLLGPDSRLPNPPFWVVVDGESMYATERMPTLPGDYDGSRRFRIKRGSAAAPGIHTREHLFGAPAAIVYRTGIYVHAKTMVVDDVFLAIGSANLNRRGLKHDGETAVFTVPMELRRTSANLARKFRIAAWADHLDLPPAIAAPLLHDPIRGSELFLREYERGNRATEIDLVGLANVVPGLLTMPTSSFFLNMLSIFGVSVLASNDEALWNTLADPTTDDL